MPLCEVQLAWVMTEQVPLGKQHAPVGGVNVTLMVGRLAAVASLESNRFVVLLPLSLPLTIHPKLVAGELTHPCTSDTSVAVELHVYEALPPIVREALAVAVNWPPAVLQLCVL